MVLVDSFFVDQTEVTVPGLHFVPEDSPVQIADAVAAWLVGGIP